MVQNVVRLKNQGNKLFCVNNNYPFVSDLMRINPKKKEIQFNGKTTNGNCSHVEALTFSFQNYVLHLIVKSTFKALKVPVIHY